MEKSSPTNPTSFEKPSNGLARASKRSLNYALERFANLSDYLSDLQDFEANWPDFYPLVLQDAMGQIHGWTPLSGGLVYWYRDMLRHFWVGATQGNEFWFLLGMAPPREYLHWEEARALDREAITSEDLLEREYLAQLQRHWSGEGDPLFGLTFRLARLAPNWGMGEFQYEPQNDFQRAVYLLWRQSWRAKVCRRCGKYFVADKPPQFYCSSKCYGEAKKDRGSKWWAEHGNDWRKGSRKSQLRKGTSKKGEKRK